MSTETHPDQIEAAAAAREKDPAGDARRWMLEVSDATLCTTCCKPGLAGHPYGSVVPFALTATGEPVIYIARIAAHTANLEQDPRASLFVRQPGVEGDPQIGWRISVMGTMRELVVDEPSEGTGYQERVSAEELEDIHARYVERVPWARDYTETHDFSYWRMSEIEKVRYIGGFGKICWLDGKEILRAPMGEGLDEAAPGVIAHMNQDHRENMEEMCAGHYGLQVGSALMEGIDRTGFTLRTSEPDHLLRFSFGREITAAQLRGAVIGVLKRARARSAANA